jgi:hypothetical protein
MNRKFKPPKQFDYSSIVAARERGMALSSQSLLTMKE